MTRSNKLTDKKKAQCVAVVEQVFRLLESQIHTRDIMTREVSGSGAMRAIAKALLCCGNLLSVLSRVCYAGI